MLSPCTGVSLGHENEALLPENTVLSDRSQSQKPTQCTTPLSAMSRTGQSVRTVSRPGVALELGQWQDGGARAQVSRGVYGADENFFKLIVGMDAQVHVTVYLKLVSCRCIPLPQQLCNSGHSTNNNRDTISMSSGRLSLNSSSDLCSVNLSPAVLTLHHRF